MDLNAIRAIGRHEPKMNDAIRISSHLKAQGCDTLKCNQFLGRPLSVQEITPMLIYMLAMAMTVLMLIATALGMHREAQRVRIDDTKRRFDGFGASRRS